MEYVQAGWKFNVPSNEAVNEEQSKPDLQIYGVWKAYDDWHITISSDLLSLTPRAGAITLILLAATK